MKLLGAKVQEITRMEIGTHVHVVTIAHIHTTYIHVHMYTYICTRVPHVRSRRYTVLVHVHMYTFIKVHSRDRGTTIVVF